MVSVMCLSRAVGDGTERPVLTAEPDLVVVVKIEFGDFCGRIVGHNDKFIHRLLEDDPDHDLMASMLVDEALRRGSNDNITVLIVWLKGMSCIRPPRAPKRRLELPNEDSDSRRWRTH
jgi:hypothetical protein